MGVNTIVYVIKPCVDKSANTADILKGLRLSAVVEQADISFESTLRRLWERTSPAGIAVSVYKGNVIVIDNGQHIDTDAIPTFTTAYPSEVLRVENSDTTDTGGFLFWRNGILVRKVSFGEKEWLYEMGITDEEIISRFQPFTIGTAQEFEKEPITPMNVLAAYALDYFDFYTLQWSIYTVTP